MDINRRKLAMGLLTVPAAAAISGCVSAAKPHKEKTFDMQAVNQLSDQLEDRHTADILAPFILDAAFNMTPPSGQIQEASMVIAFAFGNRPNPEQDPNKLALPGPMNRVLAQCCAAVWRKKHMPLYLQWEIARWMESVEFSDIPRSDIISIEPYWDDNGKLIYLSTDGVVQDIINKYFSGDASKMGKAAVIGHRDHVKRCIMTCEARQVHGFAPKGVSLPRWYDAQSDQPWTRRRDLYVLQDITAQLSMIAQANIAQAYPQG